MENLIQRIADALKANVALNREQVKVMLERNERDREHFAWMKEDRAARETARDAAQILIDEIGANGPERVEDMARRAVAIIRKLRAEQQAMQDGAKPAPPSAEGD